MLLKNQLPVDLNISTQVLQKLSNLLSQLENTLEQKSCLFSDLIDKWSTSEEELFFEVINERDEPIVFVVELAKSMLKLKEYRALVKHEDIKVLIDLDLYKQYKES